MHRCRKRCCGGGFGSRGFKPHAQLAKDILGIGKHIHQMADWRALISTDIADAIFKQRLGDGQNTFTAKHLALADTKLLDFLAE